MGNSTSALNKDSNLAVEIDRIASKYILSQNFKDINKLSEQDQCDKTFILTARIIKGKLNPLEQKAVVDRIENGMSKNAEKENDKKEKATEDKESEKEGNEIKETEKEEKEKNKIKKRGEEDDEDEERDRRRYNRNRDESSFYGGADCLKIAKFYVKIAHLYAAIMKTINPIITTIDKDGKKNKYDLLSYKELPSDSEIKSIEHNNLCTQRLNTLLQESDYVYLKGNKKSIKINPQRICEMNKGRKFYSGSAASGAASGAASTGQNEIGIPELMKLYYDDGYDPAVGDFTTMSPQMQEVYKRDTDILYNKFSGEPIATGKSINSFAEIPLREFHNNANCKNEGMYMQNFGEISISDKLIKKYEDHRQSMVSRMNSNQDKLLTILNQLFIFPKKETASAEANASATSAGANNAVTINPNLDELLLTSLINTARQLIVELYVTCETDFLEGINLLEAILKVKLAVNTSEQKKMLENYTVEYLTKHF